MEKLRLQTNSQEIKKIMCSSSTITRPGKEEIYKEKWFNIKWKKVN